MIEQIKIKYLKVILIALVLAAVGFSFHVVSAAENSVLLEDANASANVPFLINQGEPTTNAQLVELRIRAVGASLMIISNLPDFSDGVWEGYKTSKFWQLTPGNGEKHVYINFKNEAGETANPIFQTVTLALPSAIINEPAGQVLGVKIDARQEQLDQIISEAAYIWNGDAASIAANVDQSRNINNEEAVDKKYVQSLLKDLVVTESPNIEIVVSFILYGTPSTLALGAGERAGVLNSYKSAFGKLPILETEWADVIKIANGRWPGETSVTAENQVKAMFQKIYLREIDINNSNDSAAMTIIAYGLRNGERNFASEKAAILSFKNIFGHSPSSAIDWDAVRAIAYSGAVR